MSPTPLLVLAVGVLVLSASACSDDLVRGGGRLDDPAGLAIDWTIELVAADDDRVVALDPDLPLRGSMAQIGGRRIQFLGKPSGCGEVPSVSIRPKGEEVEFEVLESGEDGDCNGRLIFVDVSLRRDVNRVSVAQISAD